ncbi:uncharacterized protein LOC143446115 isoform X1 [Clavelina lepadiformis]|uniref:uncharacterized protein LOC143446115 isoform X1 n=1 Tax=Clavelina lepadiformis TaxID=159417 RepID=UPI004042CEBA
MQKYLELSLSVILQTAVMIQGQSISPVTTPHPVQATDSTVVITATAFPPSSVISSGGNWIVDWRYNGTRVAQAGYVAYPVVVSVVESSIYSSRMNISAIAMSASSFTTQLTIAQLKANEDGDLVELGGPGVGAQSIVLNIRDCNSSLPYDVIVDTTSRIFNSPGKFACSNGGELFYSNGIILTSSDTTCLASAEWSGQDNLQCWTAPNVTLASSSIEGNKLIVIEGANLSLTCNYDDVIPEGSTSRLYIGGKSYNRTQGEPFILSSLQRNDNNKVVSCQAVTPYTDVYPGSGRSLEYTLDVLYAATQDDKLPTCNWNLNETGICSVVIFSNPNSQFVSLSKNGSSVASDGSMTIESTGDQGQQTFTFTRTQVTNSDNGRYELIVKSSTSSLFSKSVLYFDIEVVDNTDGNGEPPGTPGLSTGAIAGIIAGVVVVILCAAGYGVYRWRSGSQKKNGSQSNERYPTGSGNHTLTDQPGYIDVTANDSTQINSHNQRNYEVVGPAEDENGYLAVNGSTTGHLRNRASNSQPETDNAGYVVFNGEESNAESNNQGNASSSSKRYENIEGAYDEVITTPSAHTEKSSRRYENVEGPYDEINNS